ENVLTLSKCPHFAIKHEKWFSLSSMYKNTHTHTHTHTHTTPMSVHDVFLWLYFECKCILLGFMSIEHVCKCVSSLQCEINFLKDVPRILLQSLICRTYR
ncbi:hypothetical protein XENOCAPTIV_028105, partial [Xenoophorus captivus]